MKQRWKLLVKGKVQGVYYRKSAKLKADEFGLSGWVKNEEDGSVSMEAEGDEAVLKKFVAWCQVGPSAAVVDQVVIETVVAKYDTGFEIRRF